MATMPTCKEMTNDTLAALDFSGLVVTDGVDIYAVRELTNMAVAGHKCFGTAPDGAPDDCALRATWTIQGIKFGTQEFYCVSCFMDWLALGTQRLGAHGLVVQSGVITVRKPVQR